LTPVVVSSEMPRMPASRSGWRSCRILASSPPNPGGVYEPRAASSASTMVRRAGEWPWIVIHTSSFDTFVAVTVHVAGSGHLFP
jgi:hypothetical protein